MRRILILSALLALGLAAIRHAAMRWGTSEVMAIAPILLVVTHVLAWFPSARWRAFWFGFGVCGWAYLLTALTSSLAEYLPTTWLIDGLHAELYGRREYSFYNDPFDGAGAASPDVGDFRGAGHSVLSLLFALLGGTLAGILVRAKAEDRTGSPPPDGSLLKPGWREEIEGRAG
jgi:hypothetical protein